MIKEKCLVVYEVGSIRSNLFVNQGNLAHSAGTIVTGHKAICMYRSDCHIIGHRNTLPFACLTNPHCNPLLSLGSCIGFTFYRAHRDKSIDYHHPIIQTSRRQFRCASKWKHCPNGILYKDLMLKHLWSNLGRFTCQQLAFINGRRS